MDHESAIKYHYYIIMMHLRQRSAMIWILVHTRGGQEPECRSRLRPES